MEKRGRGTIAFPFHDGSTNPTRTHHKSLSIDTLSFRCLVLLETEARIGGGLMHGMGVVVDGTSAWDPGHRGRATVTAPSCLRPPIVACSCLLPAAKASEGSIHREGQAYLLARLASPVACVGGP
jgi:hypothetical protein